MWHEPKPTKSKLSTRNSMNQELAHNRERSNLNWLKPYKGVLLYPHDTRIMQLTQPAKLDKGVLVSTVSNEAQPLRVRLACAESNLGPPGTPLYTAPWPRIWDRASTIKSKKVIGSSVPLFGYVVARKGAQSRWHPRTVLKRFKRTMPKWLLL